MEKPPYIARVCAPNGTFDVNNTVEKVIDFYAFDVLESSQIARIEINGDATTDVKEQYISAVGTAIKPGLVTAKGADYFSAITLTNGSVRLLLL